MTDNTKMREAMIDQDGAVWEKIGGAWSLYKPAQSVPVEVSDSPCAEADGCPTEKSVLQRFWREAQSVDCVVRRKRLEDL